MKTDINFQKRSMKVAVISLLIALLASLSVYSWTSSTSSSYGTVTLGSGNFSSALIGSQNMSGSFFFGSFFPDAFQVPISSETTNYTDWKMFQRNLNHTGHYPADLNISRFGTKWSYHTGFGTLMDPVVASGILYLMGSNSSNPDYNGTIIAINITNGTYLWNFSTKIDSASAYSPAVADGILYFSVDNDYLDYGRVYALNATNGSYIWNFTARDDITTSIAVYNGVLFFGEYEPSANSFFYALNATTGLQIWNCSVGLESYILSSPAVYDGSVIFGDTNGTIHSYDAMTGVNDWNFTSAYKDLTKFVASPIAGDGMIFALSNTGGIGSLFVVNASTGASIWNYSPGSFSFSTPAYKDQRLYFGTNAGYIYAVNISNQSQVWNYSTGSATGSNSIIVTQNNILLASENDDKLYILNATNGSKILDYYSPSALNSPIIADNTVYITKTSTLLALKAGYDNIKPDIYFVPPTSDAGSVVSTIHINVTASDYYFDKIRIYLYNSSFNLINHNASNNTQFYLNFSSLRTGVYYINASANDTSGNTNYTETRMINVDRSYPQILFSAPTPANVTNTSNTSVLFNVSIVEDHLGIVKWVWNNSVNLSYEDSLIFMMNLDNISAIGENSTYAVDVSRYQNNGSFQINATYVQGCKYRSCVYFDGDLDRIEIPYSQTFNFTGKNAMTMIVWVKFDNLANYQHLISLSSGAGSEEWWLRKDNGDHLQFYLYNGSANHYVTGVTPLAISRWYHLAATFNGSEMTVFVDGVRDANISAPINISNKKVSLYLGGIGIQGYFALNGSLDFAAIYNRSLSANEINYSYMSNLYKYDSDKWVLLVNMSSSPEIGLKNGTYYYYAVANTSVGYVNTTPTRRIAIDRASPTFSGDLSPLNNSFLNYSAVNFTVNISDPSGYANATLYIYNQSVLYNVSNISGPGYPINVFRGIVVDLVNGIYTWFYQLFDIFGNMFQTANQTFVVDISYPSISFVSPTPVNDTNVSSIYINLSSSDSQTDHNVILDWNNTLVFWMRMDDVNGSGHPMDKSGYGNNGSKQGHTKQATNGKIGDAFVFDGVDDFIQVPDSNSLDMNFSDFTVAFWGYFYDFQSGPRFLGKGGGVGGWRLGHQAGAVLGLQLYDGTWANYGSSSYFLQNNSWHHYVVVVNRTANFALFYRDGGYNSSVDISADSGLNLGNLQYFAIGRDAFSATYVNGSMDDVIIFRRALSSSEIQSLFNATAYPYNKEFQSLAEGAYSYKAYAQDFAGNINVTETRQLTYNNLPSLVSVNITPAVPYTYDLLDCRFNISDSDASDTSFMVNITWWKNGVLWASDDENFTVQKGIVYNTTSIGDIEEADTASGDSWICSVSVNDGHNSSVWTNSSALAINNSMPHFFIYAPDSDTLLIEHFQANDSMENDGAYFRNTTLTNAKYGKGINISGNSYMAFPAENNINISQGTFEAWLYVDGNLKDTQENRYIFRSAANEASPYNNTISFRHSTSGNWEIYLLNATANETSVTYSDSGTSTGWHHFAVTWDQDVRNATLYIDGLLVNSTASGNMPSASGSILQLGHFSSSYGHINTILDEVLVSNKVKLPSELKAKALTSPANNNDSLLNRTLQFEWIAATDLDGDAPSYRIRVNPQNIYDCSVWFDVTGISSASYIPTTPMCVDMNYDWNVTIVGAESYFSETNNFTIPSTIIINLITNETDFGQVMNRHVYNTSTDDPTPFKVENVGNVFADVRIRALDDLWTTQPLSTTYFQFMAGNSSEYGSFNWSRSRTAWRNMTNSSLNAIADLNYSSDSNLAEIELSIEVPANEPSGSKSSTLVVSGISSSPWGSDEPPPPRYVTGMINETKDQLTFASDLANPFVLPISGDIFASFYEGPVTGGSLDGTVTTFSIGSDGATGDVQIDNSTFNIYGYDNDAIKVGATHYAVAYRGNLVNGYVQTLEILTNGTLGNLSTDILQFDTDVCQDPDIIKVSGYIYAVVYTGTASDGWIKTFRITPDGAISDAVIDEYEFDPIDAREPAIINLSTNTFAIAYVNRSLAGFNNLTIATLNISSNGSITKTVIDNYIFNESLSASWAANPFIYSISRDVYALFYNTNSIFRTVNISVYGDIIGTIGLTQYPGGQTADAMIGRFFDDVYFVTYHTAAGDGYLVTANISQNGYIINQTIDSYAFNTTEAVTPYSVLAHDNIVGVVYGTSTGTGRVSSIWVD